MPEFLRGILLFLSVIFRRIRMMDCWNIGIMGTKRRKKRVMEGWNSGKKPRLLFSLLSTHQSSTPLFQYSS
jgi:hypothetical protein